MAKLLEELREAKENQSPEMKNFVCLDKKIKQLEARYEQREQELQQVGIKWGIFKEKKLKVGPSIHGSIVDNYRGSQRPILKMFEEKSSK